MTEKLVKDLLDRRARLLDLRSSWEGQWQEIAERIRPLRADFTTSPAPGEARAREVFDSTAARAARNLALAIDGMLKSEAEDWFRPVVADPALFDRDDIKAWLDDVRQRMRRAIYAGPARFTQRSSEVDLDIVTFGTGVLFVGEKAGEPALHFASCHLKDTLIAENATGEIDTVLRTVHYTPRQAAQAFGREALGRKTRERLAGEGEADRELAFLHAVLPREERDPRRRDGRHMPFASAWIDVESEHLIGEGGFLEFPFAVPRWETSTGEVYGRSPAMTALPDVKTVNEMARTLLSAGQKAVDPPLLLSDEAVVGAINTHPGGLTYVDAQRFADGGKPPIVPLSGGANIPLGREMQRDVREMILDAFLKNFLQLPGQTPNMSATEVIERSREFVRVAGPIFGRLKADYVGRIVPRVFAVLERNGGLMPRPDGLDGMPVEFEYSTAVDKARTQIENTAAQRTAELIQPFMAAKPGMLDNFDGDQMARDIGEGVGMPRRWILSRQRVEQERAKKTAGGAAQLLGDGGADLAKAVPGLADAVPGLADALPGIAETLQAALPSAAAEEGGDLAGAAPADGGDAPTPAPGGGELPI